MEITCDKEADAMYITLKNGVFGSNKKLDDYTIVDFDTEGNLLDIELLWVSERIPLSSLSKLPVKRLRVAE